MAKLVKNEISIDVPENAKVGNVKYKIELIETKTKLSKTYSWEFEVVDKNATSSDDKTSEANVTSDSNKTSEANDTSISNKTES